MMKKILLIRSTRPDIDSRLLKTCEMLLGGGFSVTVMGWDRDGFLKENNVTELKFPNGSAKLVAFERKLPHGSGIKGLFKTITFNFWIKNVVNKLGKFDAIHSCDLDTAYFSQKAAKRMHVPFVYDIYDYYADSRSMPNALRRIAKKAETKVIDNSDCTILCVEQRLKQIEPARPKRFLVIYNSPKIPELKIEKRCDDTFTLCYFGVLSDARMVRLLCEVVNETSGVKLLIGGTGPDEAIVREFAERNNNIVFFGKIPYENVLTLESKSSCLIAAYDPEIPNHKYAAPNKLYESMALGKPIIVAEGTPMADSIQKIGGGFVLKFGDKESTLKTISEARDSKMLEEMGIRMGNEYNKYSFERNKKELLDLYRSLLGGGK